MKRKKPKIKDGRTIELVSKSYQPNKAELDEDFRLGSAWRCGPGEVQAADPCHGPAGQRSADLKAPGTAGEVGGLELSYIIPLVL